MTTLAQKIDELKRTAISALLHSKSSTEDNNILVDLIYAGIEEALKMEPSDETLDKGVDAYVDWQSSLDRGRMQQFDGMLLAFRAMRAAQWVEIKEGRK